MKKIMSWIVLFSFILTGCASYKAGRLPAPDPSAMQKYEDQGGLKVGVKFLEPGESKQIFGVAKVSEVSQPVFIVVDNRTSETYEFKKSMLSQQSIPADEIASECGFSTVGRATSYGVAGLFIWPLLIPAVVDGVGSSQANQKMEDDYMYKEIKDGRINPNGLLNGVVFFDRMKDGEELVIRITNVKTNEIKLFSFKK